MPTCQLWTPETPNLYKLRITLCDGISAPNVYDDFGKAIDRKTMKLGLRTVRVSKEKGFQLNGVTRKLKGVCLHHDLGPLGAAVNKAALIRQIKIMKEMGCDAIRTAHNMPSQWQMDICDSLGMMVMAESFDMWKYPKCKNGYARFFDQWADKDITNLVKANRNHPSIVMWNPYNEGWTQPGETLTHSMLDFTRDYDPTRLVNGPSGAWDWEGGETLPKGWGRRVGTKHKPEGECEAADTVDYHIYRGPGMLQVNPRRISFLGEFGGLGHPVKGHLWKELKDKKGNWCYGGIEGTVTREGLEKTYLDLMDKLEDLAVKGLAGSIYTQTADVEVEVSGILTYDRKVLKFNPEVLRKRHEQIIRRAENEAANK